MDSLNYDNQADVIEAFNSTSRYLDDLLNIDNPYFEGMVKQIYPPELQLNKANNTDTEAPFLHLHISIENGFVSSKIYNKHDDLDFDIVNFPGFFYRRHYELIFKFNVGLKTLLREGLSEPEFYGDLVNKFKKFSIGRNNLSFQFRKIITRYRRV